MSRSMSVVPQAGQSHVRTASDNDAILWQQHAQVLLLANHGSIFTKCLPACIALYVNFLIKLSQLTSAMCLASVRFLSRFLIFNVSTITAGRPAPWLSSMSCRTVYADNQHGRWSGAHAPWQRVIALSPGPDCLFGSVKGLFACAADWTRLSLRTSD